MQYFFSKTFYSKQFLPKLVRSIPYRLKIKSLLVSILEPSMNKIIKLIKKHSYADVIRIREGKPFEDFYHYQLGLDDNQYQTIENRCTSFYCPCCGDGFEKTRLNFDDTEDMMLIWETNLFLCRSCGYWKRYMFDIIGGNDYITPFTQSLPAADAVSISHLANEIAKAPDKLYSMSPYKFEQFVGSVLNDFYNCEVNYIGQSNDDGVDLIMVQAEHPVLVQVKRRSDPHSSENVNVVKNLFASMYGNNASKGMIVTTAQRFSKVAEEWLAKPAIKNSNLKIDLINMQKLLEMISVINQQNIIAGNDFFEKGIYNKIFSRYETKVIQQSMEFVMFIGIDGKNYFYLPSDMQGFYLMENTQSLPLTANDIASRSKRLNGAVFYWATCALNKDAMFPVLRNWAKYTGRALYQDDDGKINLNIMDITV